MANSKFEYVRSFEEATDPVLVKNCYVAIRVDGQNFTQFSKSHRFHKPNDKRALDLMNDCAQYVMRAFYPNIKTAYGQSDEYSFIMSRKADCFKRRGNKIVSLVVSAFASAYVFNWPKFFKDDQGKVCELKYPPAFDGRCVLYPSEKEMIDYLRWRYVDCHINNVYNTTFYTLTGDYINYSLDDQGRVITKKLESDRKPLTPREAQERLKGSLKKDKHDIMFLEYGINYNNELEQFKKGSLLILEKEDGHDLKFKNIKKLPKEELDSIKIKCLNVDVTKDEFWEDHRYLLE